MAKKEKNLSHAETTAIEELEVLKNWWNKHSNLITIIMCVILIAVIGVTQYTKYQTKKENESVSALFGFNNSPENLEEIVAAGSSKKLVSLARLRLANMYYMMDNIDLALTTYEDFLKDAPKSQMAPLAEMGIAYCLESKGDVEKAAQKFKEIADKYPKGFLSQNATISYARNLIFLDKKDQAKTILDIFLTENAGTKWAESADELISAMDRIKVPTPATKKIDLESFFANTANVEAAEAAPADTSTEEASSTEEAPAADSPAADDSAN